jgi:hypothetical protein
VLSAHLILLDFITLIVFGEENKLQVPSYKTAASCYFFFLTSKFSPENCDFNLHLCSQCMLRYQVAQPHRTNKSYMFLDSRWEEKRL